MKMTADDLKVGDVIGLVWVKRYQHGATMRITKINKKSFKAVEVKGSYGGPCEVGHSIYKNGREAAEWAVHKTSNFVIYPDYNDESKGWQIRLHRVYPDHYGWDR